MAMDPVLSVIIPTYNGAATLAEQLDAVASQAVDWPFEVVVSDNGSTDSTVVIANGYMKRFRRLVVVDSSDQRGVAHARNVGVARSSGRYLLFCDQDDVVGTGWLVGMAAALEQHPFVAARLDHHRLNPEWTVRIFGEAQRDELPGREAFLPFAWGGTLGIHREVHESVGGFDEHFRSGGEDNDYCWRIQLQGTPLRLADEALVHFRHRQRLREIYRQALGYGRESARLHSRYATHGMETPPRTSFTDTLGLLVWLPRALWSTEHRALWLAAVATRVGRAQGRKADPLPQLTASSPAVCTKDA